MGNKVYGKHNYVSDTAALLAALSASSSGSNSSFGSRKTRNYVSSPRIRPAVVKGAQRMMKRAMSQTETKGNKRRKQNIRRVSVHNGGKKAGFISRPKIITSSRKKMSQLGVYYTQEASQVQTSDDCAYIGHSTCVINTYKLLFCLGLLKTMLIEMNAPVDDLSRVMTDYGFVAGDQFVLVYRRDVETSTPVLTGSWTVAAQSITGVATAMSSIFDSWTDNQFQLVEFRFVPINIASFSRMSINLKNAHVEFDVKSSLKIQNRTVDVTTDDTSENVNNVPLNGKKYEGKGNGTTFTANYDITKALVGDYNTGVISKDATLQGLLEPAFGHMFKDVTREGKIRMDPGDLQTSVLTEHKKYSVNSLILKLWPNVNTPSRIDMGQFRFFGLEKMIGGLSTEKIRVAYELNTLIGCTFYKGKYTYTSNLFSKVNV